METNEKNLIKYFKSLGLEIHTSTKARGHQGFYLNKRIDISKNIPQNRIIPTLLHEFTHHIHSQLEPIMTKNGGSLKVIFDDDNITFYENELLTVTNFVDKNSKFEKFLQHKNNIKEEISNLEKIIKEKYPLFKRSKKFKEFNSYIKKSNAKYLLKYDRVKLVTGAFATKKIEILSIDNIEKDFCDMPKEFAAYIRLKSYTKKLSRISSRINKLRKYYSKPTELFARFVEGLYLDNKKILELAPNTYKRFYELLQAGYYNELFDISEYFTNREVS